jgi:hypothetical protein
MAQERNANPTMRTVSTRGSDSTSGFPDWTLVPRECEFGPVRLGHVYRVTALLNNIGSRTGRFQVMQPTDLPDGVHLRVLYRPGSVAAGLDRRLEIELCSLVETQLDLSIAIRTEKFIFHLPVGAVVEAASYEEEGKTSARNGKKAWFGKAGSVRLVSTEPTAKLAHRFKEMAANVQRASRRDIVTDDLDGRQFE